VALAGPLLLQGEGGQERPAGWRALLLPERLPAAALGTVFFGVAHVVVALLNGMDLVRALLVVPLGFLAGLGLSLALQGRPRMTRQGAARWLLRLAVAGLAFLLTQWVFVLAGDRWANTLAIGWGGDFYDTALSRSAVPWWQQFVQHYPQWYQGAALIDALLVGIVLTIGITLGVSRAARLIQRWQSLAHRAGD